MSCCGTFAALCNCIIGRLDPRTCACGLGDTWKSLCSGWQASAWGRLEKCWDSSSFLLSAGRLFFLSSWGMQGWNIERHDQGKTSRNCHRRPYFCFCSGHLHKSFSTDFCTLFWNGLHICCDFPACAAVNTRAFMHADACKHRYPHAAIDPSTLFLSAIVWSHNPAAPSVAIVTDNINLNSPASLAPSSASFSCLPLLYLASLSFIPVAPLPFCHFPIQSHKRRKIQG